MYKAKIIMGIDPGLATVGYAFLKVTDLVKEIIDFGTINTGPELEFSERLLIIQKDLEELIKKYRPDEVLVEELFFSRNVKTALDVAQARGVILMSVRNMGLKPRSITPNQVKLGLTGDGNADKIQMQDMLKLEFNLSERPRPDDAADALGVAFCGARSKSPNSSECPELPGNNFI